MSFHKIRTGPLPGDQGQPFPNPLFTNHIVQAHYIRAQRHSWVVRNRVLTIGAVCGKACALAQVVVESSLYQAKVCKGPSISRDMQLLLRHKFLVGATPQCRWHGQLSGLQHQANSPHLRREATLKRKTTSFGQN